jgi:two-component system NtrC family response regulator
VSAADIGLPVVGGDEPAGGDLDLRQARETAERRVVLAALSRTAGNMARAADLLCVSRPTLYDLMHRLGIRQQITD